ncbi:MAG: preprotein translocase subunit SecG [Anaerolineales bacterium]|nr:preprotein translocase subunit SecG [Anaerolineales bacterium]
MDLQAFAPYLGVIEVVLGLVITVMVVLQSKGNDMSSFLGGEASNSFRTKRGLEAQLYRLTIYFSIAFFIVTFFAFIAMGQASAG